jgi:membrane protein YdbS with pleckstrin-like domain
MNHNIVDKQKPKWTYRRSLIRIATVLVFTIAVLAVVQWAVGTRGWDLTAGLLTIVMVALGFVLVAVIAGIKRARPLTVEEVEQHNRHLEETSFLPWNQPSWHDPSDIGSPLYRDPHRD